MKNKEELIKELRLKAKILSEQDSEEKIQKKLADLEITSRLLVENHWKQGDVYIWRRILEDKE